MHLAICKDIYQDVYRNIDPEILNGRIYEIGEMLNEVESLEAEAFAIHTSRLKEAKNKDEIFKEDREYKKVISTLSMLKAEYRVMELFIKEMRNMCAIADIVNVDTKMSH